MRKKIKNHYNLCYLEIWNCFYLKNLLGYLYSFESSDKSNGVNFPSDFYLRLSPTPQRNRGFPFENNTSIQYLFFIFSIVPNFLSSTLKLLGLTCTRVKRPKAAKTQVPTNTLFDFKSLLLILQNESRSTGPLSMRPKDIKIWDKICFCCVWSSQCSSSA